MVPSQSARRFRKADEPAERGDPLAQLLRRAAGRTDSPAVKRWLLAMADADGADHEQQPQDAPPRQPAA
jgi:hypothetical protein